MNTTQSFCNKPVFGPVCAQPGITNTPTGFKTIPASIINPGKANKGGMDSFLGITNHGKPMPSVDPSVPKVFHPPASPNIHATQGPAPHTQSAMPVAAAAALGALCLSGCHAPAGGAEWTALAFGGITGLMLLNNLFRMAYNGISRYVTAQNQWVSLEDRSAFTTSSSIKWHTWVGLANLLSTVLFLDMATDFVFSSSDIVGGIGLTAICLMQLVTFFWWLSTGRENVNTINANCSGFLRNEMDSVTETSQKRFLAEKLPSGIDPAQFANNNYFLSCLRYFFAEADIRDKPDTSPLKTGKLPHPDIINASKDLFQAFAEFMVCKLLRPGVSLKIKQGLATGLCDYTNNVATTCPDDLVWQTIPCLTEQNLALRDSLVAFHKAALAKATPLQKSVLIDKLAKEVQEWTMPSHNSDYYAAKVNRIKALIMFSAILWSAMNATQQRVLLQTYLNIFEKLDVGPELKVLAEELEPHDQSVRAYSDDVLREYIKTRMPEPNTTVTTPEPQPVSVTPALPTEDPLQQVFNLYCDNHNITDPNQVMDALVAFELNAIDMSPSVKQHLRQLAAQNLEHPNPSVAQFCSRALATLSPTGAATEVTESPPDDKKHKALAAARQGQA